jgi:hypothetical protein
VQPLADQSPADAQHAGHFVGVHPFQVPQNEDCPLLVGQLVQTLPYLAPHLIRFNGDQGQRFLAPVAHLLRINEMPVRGKTWHEIFDVVFPPADT